MTRSEITAARPACLARLEVVVADPNGHGTRQEAVATEIGGSASHQREKFTRQLVVGVDVAQVRRG